MDSQNSEKLLISTGKPYCSQKWAFSIPENWVTGHLDALWSCTTTKELTVPVTAETFSCLQEKQPPFPLPASYRAADLLEWKSPHPGVYRRR